MARSMLDDNPSEQAEARAKPKRYRFELSRFQLSSCFFGLVVALTWMFIFGLLVGRGIPLVDPSDISFRGAFLRFLGLGRQTPPPPENVAQTWEDQKKMLESLNYYEDLTQKTLSLGPKSTHAPAPTPAPTSPKKTAADQTDPKLKVQPSSQTAGSPQSAAQPEKTPPQQPPGDLGGPDSSSEHFTLLISSLRDSENAQRLVDQLKAKGYPARIEALELSGSRWNRVLVGSFQNRTEALKFAAEFNRKEKTEGLVIRESR